MLLMLPKKEKTALVVAAYCPAALHSVMTTAQPGWNASVLLGRRKGYLCFLHITVTQTCSLKLFCSLDGLHNSLPDLHNNKLKRGRQEKHLLLDKKGLRTPDLDGGTRAQSGRLKRHKSASIQTEGRENPAHTSCRHQTLGDGICRAVKVQKCLCEDGASFRTGAAKSASFKGLLAEQCLLSMFSIRHAAAVSAPDHCCEFVLFNLLKEADFMDALLDFWG